MLNQQKIPNGWREVKLGDVSVINKSSLPSNTPDDYKFKYLDLSLVHSGKVSVPKKFTNFANSPSRARRKIENGDVLMSTVRPNLLGHCLASFNTSNVICSTGFAVLQGKSMDIHNGFLYYNLFSKDVKKQIDSMLAGSSYPAINSSQVGSLKLLAPSISEQDGIVKLLQVWDRCLEKLDKKIKLKRKVKKGLTLLLLTGKNYSNELLVEKGVRFYKVPKHWRVVPISDVAKEISIKNKDYIELPVLSCTKHSGLVDSLKFFKKQIFSKNLSTYKIVNKNQFVYATNHIEEGSIGVQNLYDRGLVSPMYTVFQTNEEVLNEYLYPLLKTELFRCIFEATTSSSVNRRGSLRWKAFSKIKIPLPPLDEQKKIVDLFSVADKEIRLLEKQRKLIANQKKYLLNNLITGQIRLPEFVK
jgi:type I restriction enzyme S subunit